MTQQHGCNTFEYCALPTRLCNEHVEPGTIATAIDQLCTPDPIMQKYALSPNFDTIGAMTQNNIMSMGKCHAHKLN